MGEREALAGRVVAVTGANGGIGSYTALGLARLGAHVVLICRSRERGEATRAFIQREVPDARTSLLVADLSRMDEVRRLARDVTEAFPALSVLVNNAGVIAPRRILTENGFELTFAVNHLAPFLLSTSILDVLRANAPARIVNVNSDSHLSAKLEFGNLNAERRFWPPRAYGQSKLANMLFTKELARRIDPKEVTVNALHPGLVATDFGDVGGVVSFGWSFMKHFGLTPAQGARTPIYCASSSEVAALSGVYFRECRPAQPNPAAVDIQLAARLWDHTRRMLDKRDTI